MSSQCRTGHRRVKVEASCCANLDAPAPDAGWTRQQRPSGRRAKRRSVMQSEVLLIEVPQSFIALCAGSDVSPQAVLRGMIAVLCTLHVEESKEAVGLYATAVG